MARRHEKSKAHVYDRNDACVYCSMYRVNVENMSHVCKQWREDLVDAAEAGRLKMSLRDYRMGSDFQEKAG